MASMDRATAENEFNNLAEDWELDFNDLDDESASVVEKQKNTIIKGFINGKLSFSDDGLKMDVRSADPIFFNVPKGSAYLETDRTKENEYMKKLYNFMGAMTGKPPMTLAKMDGRDCKLAQAIVGLFMSG